MNFHAKAGNMTFEAIEPRCGEDKWGVRPPNVDCCKCWPDAGYGFRGTRAGKKRLKEEIRVKIHDIKGPCFTCVGTGLEAIPFTEVLKGGDWGPRDVDKWLRGNSVE